MDGAKTFLYVKSLPTLLHTSILLPQMPILGSSNSAANKDMMSKIWTNGDTII